MRVDLRNLENGRLHRTYPIAEAHPVAAGLDGEIREPLGLDVEVTNPAAGTYVMTAELTGQVMAPCRRCLEPTAVEIEERFRIVYRERSRDLEDEETGDIDLVLIERGANEIEIDSVVRDRLFLETNRYPLCRRDCEGICPRCGQDWNEGDCDCEFDTVDSRWKALEELREGIEAS